MRRSMWTLAASLTACVLSACATDSGKRDLLADNPLPFDPMHKYVLAEWWTNGEQLIHLQPNFGYRIFADENRYGVPVERGQWSRRTYAALEFEPYDVRREGAERVVIDRLDDETLVMVIRDLKPFVGVDEPPRVLEDELFGIWSNDQFRVALRSDMRYRFERVAALPPGTAGLAGHDGRWEMSQETVILQPDARGLEPILIDVVVRDDALVLDGMMRE